MSFLAHAPALRRLAWRFGRKLYAMARGEERNDPTANGEYWLQQQVISGAGKDAVLMDVGANQGDWTLQALRQSPHGGDFRIHAFEPCTGTRSILAANTSAFPNVSIHAVALSDTAGTASFYSKGAGAGTNSLDPSSGNASEQVLVSTCDAFLGESGTGNVSMLKIDTEGFDLMVLRGAAGALSEGRIECVQFEYNWRWLLNHASLRDVFLFIADKPYRFGKLVGESIEFHEDWHFELDRFFENNYVLIRKDSKLVSLGRAVRFDESNIVVDVA